MPERSLLTLIITAQCSSVGLEVASESVSARCQPRDVKLLAQKPLTYSSFRFGNQEECRRTESRQAL